METEEIRGGRTKESVGQFFLILSFFSRVVEAAAESSCQIKYRDPGKRASGTGAFRIGTGTGLREICRSSESGTNGIKRISDESE